MPKYIVPLTTWANASITIETDETDLETVARMAEEKIHASLCHQCSNEGNSYLEIGDEWTVPTHPTTGKPEVHIESDESEA